MPNKPPSEWFDKHLEEVKKGNPSYNDEQARKTVGDIWYHKMSPSKKQEETKKSEGSMEKKADEPGWDDHDLDQAEDSKAVIPIKLENVDGDPEAASVWANWEDVQNEQSVLGSMWEHDGDLAYAYIMDEPGLVEKLRAEGYDVDDSEYYPFEPEGGTGMEAAKKTAAGFGNLFSSDAENWIRIETTRLALQKGTPATPEQAGAYLQAAASEVTKSLTESLEPEVQKVVARNKDKIMEEITSLMGQAPIAPTAPTGPTPPGPASPPPVEPASAKKAPMTIGLQRAFENSSPEAYAAIGKLMAEALGEGFQKTYSIDEIVDMEEDILATVGEENPDL